MFQKKVNKTLCLIKANYFLTFGTIAPMAGFLPTIVRQFGYSITTFGTVMMLLSMVTMMIVPVSGIIFERFHLKKSLFFTITLLLGVSTFFFMFVPKVPLEMAVNLKCETTFMLIVNTDSQNAHDRNIFVNEKNANESITCKLNCQDTNVLVYDHVMHRLSNRSNFDSDLTTTEKPAKNQIDVTFKFTDVNYTDSERIFKLSSILISGTSEKPSTCRRGSNTFCSVVNCTNDAIVKLTNAKTYKGNVIDLYQFWILVFTLLSFMACVGILMTLQSPICLDILEDKPEDFGRQKCWGSIGWGLFSIFIGWLVDKISVDKNEKDYSPICCSAIVLTFFNLIVISKIKVVETKKTVSKPKSVYKVFANRQVIFLYVWSAFCAFFHTIIMHFLFWYVEDLVSANNVASQRAWIKTLQGLAQGVQCFGGEIPFYFWSGRIIRATGGHLNCMALVLGAMAVRLYLYTVIWDPVWIVAIELLNGVSYALGDSVKMSYAKSIAPPGTSYTMIGFLGCTDRIADSVASLLGGYLFGSYGGVWSFRFFAFTSGFLCFLNILNNMIGFSKEVNNCHFVEIPLKTVNGNENAKIEN